MLEFYKTPLTANLIITRNCNGNCIFCGVEHKSNFFEIEKKIDKIKRIIDILYENDILRINFFGGEPMIYPDIIEAVKYAKEKGFYTTLITNGILWSSKNDEMKNYLDGIAVSVHGNKESHIRLTRTNDTVYNLVLKHIKKISDLKIPLTLNMTVTAQNYLDIPDFVENLLNNYNISGFAFNRYISNPELPDDINNSLLMNKQKLNKSLELIDELSKKYKNVNFKYAIHFPLCIVQNRNLLKYVGCCGFAQNYISVDCDGNIQPCSYMYETIGNLFEDNLEDVWKNSELLKEYRKLEWLPNDCKQCELFENCYAGCKETRNDVFSYDILLDEVHDV